MYQLQNMPRATLDELPHNKMVAAQTYTLNFRAADSGFLEPKTDQLFDLRRSDSIHDTTL